MNKYSTYFTTKNCIQMNYPFVESIKSTFQFTDEIIVCDTSDANEGTKDLLNDLSKEFGKTFKIITPDFVDWNAKNSGIYDGITKAYARSQCVGQYLWQMDVDEVLEENCKNKIDNLSSNLDNDNPLMATLVVEYWSSNKIRIDINAWKERLSLNLPNIIHGIPITHRKYVDGLLYSHPGSDGCNIIYKDSGLPINCLNFISNQSEDIRRKAITDEKYVPVYENWVNKISNKLPTVHHFSWWSVYQKMLKYKLFWNKSWQQLYGPDKSKPAGWNPFFNKPFDQVTDEEMRTVAKKLEEECAGFIFHNQVDLNNIPKTNYINFHKPVPTNIINWCSANKTPVL